MRGRVLGFLVWVIYRLLSATWRVQWQMPASLQEHLSKHEPVLFGHWHGDELAMIHETGKLRIATMASTSKDGEIMNTALQLLGGRTSRGSSTRGGANGLRGLIRLVREEGRNCSFAVDGPKGPLHKVKPGIFEISRLLKAPIYPAAVRCDRAWHFPRSWNKAYLPKPFAKLSMYWGEEIPAIGPEDDPRSEVFQTQLEAALQKAQVEAQNNLVR